MKPNERTKEEPEKKIAGLREADNNREKRDTRLRLLATVVAESNEAIIVQDLQGRIIAWNKGAEKMYGYTEDEALELNISEILPDDRKQEALSLIEQIRNGKEIDSLQTKRITKDGRIIDVWLTPTKLVDDNGDVAGLSTSERDITEHNKRLEEVESALALAEEYTREIERLVAERTAGLIALNMADRVTNPVVVIGMVCRRLLARQDIDKAARDKLKIILEESDKLRQIVREFDAFIQRKYALFRYEDLNGIVKEAIMLIRRDAEGKGIKLNTALSDAPLMINMNRNVLRTAIFYIFKNALDATRGGGSITASTSEDGDSVYLTISDTGRGISEENIRRVFDNFFTTRINGAGMGLPFVKHIVEEHYGNIKIESRKDIGTTCTIRFPVRWLKLSDGKLRWEHPMLPVSREREEYPLEPV